MAFSKGNSSVSLDEVKSKVSEADLAFYYLGIKSIPCVIKSPLRKDTKPSFGIYTSDGVTVRWIDYATSQRGGIYDLLGLLWNTNFRGVLDRIEKDMTKIGKSFGRVSSSAHSNALMDINSYQKSSTLEVKVREWRDYDVKYWESYGVPLKWLKYAEVYPISHKIITTNRGRFVLGVDKYAYVFVEHKEGKVTLKVYQPFNKEGYKWMNKHDRSVVSLWTKVPEYGDRIVICSSMKDALCLWANTEIPALAIQGEGYGMSDTAISELKRRYKQVYIMLDNDEPGIKDAQVLAQRTGFTNVVLPHFEGGKDISDYYKAVGKHQFVETMKSLFGLTPYSQWDDWDDDLPF